MTASILGLPKLAVIFLVVASYVVVGTLIFGLIIFASVKAEAWIRRRAALTAGPVGSGPGTASSQERRAAADLGYLRRGHD